MRRLEKAMCRIAFYVVCCFWVVEVYGQDKEVFYGKVNPLVRTHWGQGVPFNLLCPKNDDGGVLSYNLAGCGSVAMAQIVNYHQYPSRSPDGEYWYDWWKMYRMFDQRQTQEELISVAKLISDCGVSSFTEYSEKASGTSLSAVMGALKRLFFYGDQIGIYARDSMMVLGQDSLFRQLLYEELKAGRPVLYRGSNPAKGGHLFIIDGCKGGKVHVNMGWASDGDGYYDLDDLHGYGKEQWMLTEVADTNYHPVVKEVNLAKAGTLGQCLSEEEQRLTRHLKVSGLVDEQDFGVLRQMLRRGILRTIDMEDANIEYLPDSAFCGCTFFSYFVMPRTVRRIGNGTFYSCRNLNRVVFPDSLESIGNGAFCGCNNLLALHLPPSVKHIMSNAFNSCEVLLNVTIPEGVESVGSWAFSHCHHLNSLALPKSLRSVGNGFLNDCPRLKRVTVDEGNPLFYSEGLTVKRK